MAYHVNGIFKGILKIISLGVLISINGLSHEVLAMDGELESAQARLRTYQGDFSPDEAIQLAMELSLEGSSQRVPRDDSSVHSAASSMGGASSAAADGMSFDEQMARRLHEELNGAERHSKQPPWLYDKNSYKL